MLMTAEEIFETTYRAILIQREILKGTFSIEDKPLEAATKVLNIFGHDLGLLGLGVPVPKIMIETADNNTIFVADENGNLYWKNYSYFSNHLNQCIKEANKATGDLDKDQTNRMIELLKRYCNLETSKNGTIILSLK